MRVFVSNRINATLRDINAYYNQLDRRDVANRITGELETTINKLAKYQSNRRTSSDLPGRFRRVLAGYYIIYYEVDSKEDTVYVYQVRHGAQKPLAPSTHRQLARDVRRQDT